MRCFIGFVLPGFLAVFIRTAQLTYLLWPRAVIFTLRILCSTFVKQRKLCSLGTKFGKCLVTIVVFFIMFWERQNNCLWKEPRQMVDKMSFLTNSYYFYICMAMIFSVNIINCISKYYLENFHMFNQNTKEIAISIKM